MKKIIEISGSELTLKSSVHTWFVYKAGFGSELSEDMARAVIIAEQREKETDEVKRAALFGAELRLFLQIIWAFADEGTPEMPPFETWIERVESIDLPAAITAVTELYSSTIKPDRKNRGIGQEKTESGSISTEQLADMLLTLGISISDMRDITVGQAINIIHEHVRNRLRAQGESVPDPEQRYKMAKEIVELIESGQVEDYDQQEYEKLKRLIKEWEAD